MTQKSKPMTVDNPHTARLLALTRQLADNMIASGQRNPEYEILSEMMLARRAEVNWHA